MFSVFLIATVCICGMIRLWCGIAFNNGCLLHISHIQFFCLLSLHFNPLFTWINQLGLLAVVIIVSSSLRCRLAITRSMSTMLPVRTTRSPRTAWHFTLVVRHSFAARPMPSTWTRIIWRLTLDRARTMSVTVTCIVVVAVVAISRRCRTNGFWTWGDAE